MPEVWNHCVPTLEHGADAQVPCLQLGLETVMNKCKGMNCGATEGILHSAECQAEHAAALAGGVFIKQPVGDVPMRERAEMSAHTPGPWEAIETRVYFPNLAGGFDICKCPNPEANARLIAAAPENYACNVELAKIVRELCAAYNHPLPQASLDRSDAAIAKAEGI